MKEHKRIIRRHDGLHTIVSDDKRKVDALAISKKGIGSDLTEQDKEAFAGIKELQKEFQAKYCLICKKYDIVKKEFIFKGHLNNPNNCQYHYIDILGQCWNYEKADTS